MIRLGDGVAALYPVLAGTSDGVVAAWTAGAGQSTTIGVRRLSMW